MSRLENKIALVTGAGRGIGRAVAELFAGEGATVVMVARTAADLEEAAAAIEEKGGAAVLIPGDITEASVVAHVFQEIREQFGRLDILINNAGIAPFGPIEELPVERLRACLELNVVAVYACTQHAVRLMRETGGVGKIINVGSVRSHWTEAGDGGAYNASKYALRGMTESIARQLHGAGLNIAVGLICPGGVDTPLTNPKREPRPDWLRPETVAEAVLHAVTVPDNINMYDMTLFSTVQKPW